MAEQIDKSWLERAGDRVSQWVADVAGHPFAQMGFIVLCVGWFVVGWNVNLFTAALSILAITLTQMVLNRQNEREIDDHRRDVAMHAKLDELISATRAAKNEFVGIEEREEEEIVQLKEEVKEAIEEAPEARDPDTRETAKRAVDKAAEELKRQSGSKRGRRAGTKKGATGG
jgi:low affinity Fe/Cu permease